MSKFNMGDYFKYKSKHYDVLGRIIKIEDSTTYINHTKYSYELLGGKDSNMGYFYTASPMYDDSVVGRTLDELMVNLI